MTVDMKDCARKKWHRAFVIALRNCVRTKQIRKDGRVRNVRAVQPNEQECALLYDFYRKYVNDDREEAAQALVACAKEAGRKPPVVSCVIFVFFLVFVLLNIFGNLWYAVLAILLSALVTYLLIARTRRAAAIWVLRDKVKDDRLSAPERMCVVLASSPLRSANYTVIGGLSAAILIAAYYSIGVTIFG